jgi:hypothetical protein
VAIRYNSSEAEPGMLREGVRLIFRRNGWLIPGTFGSLKNRLTPFFTIRPKPSPGFRSIKYAVGGFDVFVGDVVPDVADILFGAIG